MQIPEYDKVRSEVYSSLGVKALISTIFELLVLSVVINDAWRRQGHLSELMQWIRYRLSAWSVLISKFS